MVRSRPLLTMSWLLAAAIVLVLAGSVAAQTTAATNNVTPSRSIALTIDDLPMTVVGNDHIAAPLAESREIANRSCANS